MTHDDIIAALESTPPVLAHLVRGLDEDALRRGHDDETWSVKEVLVHLRDADEISSERFRRLAQEEGPFLPAYDQAAYARERGYQEQDAGAALTAFTESRGRMVKLLSDLGPNGMQRPGTHEETGPITIGSLAEHLISHDLSHLAQIVRAL